MRHLELPGRREHGLKGDFRQWEPLFLAKAGQHPPLTRSRRPVATHYYASLLASLQNDSGAKPAVKIPGNVAEPSADAIYNAYLN
jgi:hypothetical protein